MMNFQAFAPACESKQRQRLRLVMTPESRALLHGVWISSSCLRVIGARNNFLGRNQGENVNEVIVMFPAFPVEVVPDQVITFPVSVTKNRFVRVIGTVHNIW